MEGKVYIFISDMSSKVNVMHEYIFSITHMQIIVTLLFMPNPAISLLSVFLPVEVLIF